MKKPPAEVVASLLAITTILIHLHPYNFPPWAIFVSWAGTFAMGGPSKENLKRIWPVLPLGAFVGFLVVLGFKKVGTMYTGTELILAQMVVLFCLNGGMMSIARFVPLFSFIPGMFFGFASFFATMFGGFGPEPGNPYTALAAVVVMNALGPLYALITARCSAPHGTHH
jgi:hypothetical protein